MEDFAAALKRESNMHYPVLTDMDNGYAMSLNLAIWVGEEMARRFGLPYWQFCLTATDANRFTIRLARAILARARATVASPVSQRCSS